ncbi:MAG: NAD(P)/FAD-dependent oxidoreductase [Candidatus Omnitrophota bacterium]|jgi:predicted Rossmann fold flavoprotein|nr:MAG: NAD(P)/FAD-dependent oxidoreductase [Candidatus Omnitrophota bacterium]
MKRDVIVIGAGAAGLFCAIEAGKRSRSVLVLEHNDRIGRKISVSGGGRCNFTNIHASPDCYLSANPHFCISALSRFTPMDFIDRLERNQINFHEKKQGQLFCDENAKQIIQMLSADCQRYQVEILFNCSVFEMDKYDSFQVRTNYGVFESNSLVIATGGLSVTKLGASDLGYRAAKRFGLAVTEVRPALVPLVFSAQDREWGNRLRGISCEASVRCGKITFQDDVLFTHRGLSGPAILQISSYWKENQAIFLNLFPWSNIVDILRQYQGSDLLLSTLLARYLPKKLAKTWCELHVRDIPVRQYPTKEIVRIADLLQNWRIDPSGTEGFNKAEVTSGGVDTRELSPKTMESRTVSGLFFTGEVLDVTGRLGGYNFQWAWSSGYCAGIHI